MLAAGVSCVEFYGQLVHRARAIRMGRANMFGPKVKIEKSLYEKIKMYASISGYSSVDEFVAHALEKEVAQLEEAESEDEIKKKLQGLGYIS